MTKIPPKEFKINISKNEIKLFKNLAHKYSVAPTQQLKTQMFDVFVPHIQEASENAARQYGVSPCDYFQKLSLKFLQFLDSVIKSESPATQMAYRLTRVNPSEDDIMSLPHETLDSISSDFELEYLSCSPDERTLLQKAEEITDVVKPILKEKKEQAISMFLDGKEIAEIAQSLGIKRNRVYDILREVVEKIKKQDKNGQISEIFFDDTPNTDRHFHKIRKSSERTVLPQKGSSEEYPAEKIWELVKDCYDKTTEEELDSLLRTQTGYRELLFSEISRTYVKKRLNIDPNFKIVLKLGKKNDTDKFRAEAAAISIRLFGKNIFEFAS